MQVCVHERWCFQLYKCIRGQKDREMNAKKVIRIEEGCRKQALLPDLGIDSLETNDHN